MRENAALQEAIDATAGVHNQEKTLTKLRLDRAKAIFNAFEEGYTRAEISKATGLHEKTIDADLKQIRAQK